jgi:hypothetical protein
MANEGRPEMGDNMLILFIFKALFMKIFCIRQSAYDGRMVLRLGQSIILG